MAETNAKTLRFRHNVNEPLVKEESLPLSTISWVLFENKIKKIA